MDNRTKKLVNVIIALLILLFIIYLTIKLLPIFTSLSTEHGRLEFKDKIEGLGTKGVLLIIGLMIAQIFLPILPGEPVELLSGMCFGAVHGMIIVLLGAVISATIIIFGVKFLGRKFIYAFVKKEKLDKIENSKIFSNKKKIDIIIFLLFFIPGTPKDIFVYLGGLLPVNPWKFILISSFARIPSIISSTIAGANLLDGRWTTIVMVYAITFGLSGILIYILSRKNPEVKEIMKQEGK